MRFRPPTVPDEYCLFALNPFIINKHLGSSLVICFTVEIAKNKTCPRVLDAIIYPSWSNPPRKIGDSESPHGNNSPIIAPHTGQPTITVPMGYVNENLPAGLQMLGRPFSEAKLLQYAYAYEQQTKHRKSPSQFGRISPSRKNEVGEEWH